VLLAAAVSPHSSAAALVLHQVLQFGSGTVSRVPSGIYISCLLLSCLLLHDAFACLSYQLWLSYRARTLPSTLLGSTCVLYVVCLLLQYISTIALQFLPCCVCWGRTLCVCVCVCVCVSGNLSGVASPAGGGLRSCQPCFSNHRRQRSCEF
jgi:hypothetical protein